MSSDGAIRDIVRGSSNWIPWSRKWRRVSNQEDYGEITVDFGRCISLFLVWNFEMLYDKESQYFQNTNIFKLQDPALSCTSGDFQLLTFLGRTEMLQIQRHQSNDGYFPFPRRLSQRILLQMNATKAMRDIIVDFLAGRVYIEPYTWNFLVSGGYLKYYEPSHPANIGEYKWSDHSENKLFWFSGNLLAGQPAPVAVVSQGIAHYIPPHQNLQNMPVPRPAPVRLQEIKNSDNFQCTSFRHNVKMKMTRMLK